MESDHAHSVDAYHLHRPEAARGRRRGLVFFVVATVLWLALSSAYSSMTVNIDGIDYRMPVGTSVGEIVRSGLVKAPRGDLLSLTGEVAQTAAGGYPRVRVDGRDAPLTARVFDGARITSSRGRNAVEAAVTTLAATPIPVVESGRGPETTIDSIGAPGLALVKMGRVSRSIVDSRTIVAASPMRLRHTPLTRTTMVLALTFDDGPWPGQTERVLDILKSEGVHATFFVLGARARARPDLLKRMDAEGHTIGSHSMSHPDLTRVTPDQLQHQMAVSQAIIRDATGVTTSWFRAPGGSVNGAVHAKANELGMRVIRWQDDPGDWRKPPASQIVAHVVGGFAPGAVILLHDGGGDRTNTIAALPEIIRIGKERGYRFVSLDEMYATDTSPPSSPAGKPVVSPGGTPQ